jgi:hypothetical protein
MHHTTERASSFEDPLPLPFGQHVAGDDLLDDASEEGIASWLTHEPPLPFEFVQCVEERLTANAGAVLQSLATHPFTEDRGNGEELLRVVGESSKANADRRDHRVREVGWKRLIQRLVRLRPRADNAAEVHAERDRVKQLDREKR